MKHTQLFLFIVMSFSFNAHAQRGEVATGESQKTQAKTSVGTPNHKALVASFTKSTCRPLQKGLKLTNELAEKILDCTKTFNARKVSDHFAPAQACIHMGYAEMANVTCARAEGFSCTDAFFEIASEFNRGRLEVIDQPGQHDFNEFGARARMAIVAPNIDARLSVQGHSKVYAQRCGSGGCRLMEMRSGFIPSEFVLNTYQHNPKVAGQLAGLEGEQFFKQSQELQNIARATPAEHRDNVNESCRLHRLLKPTCREFTVDKVCRAHFSTAKKFFESLFD